MGIRNLLAANSHENARIVHFGNRLPRQSVPQGHLLRGADWLAMTRCVGDGVLQWSAAEQMPLGYDVPSARQRRAVIPSQCSHWHGNPSPHRGDTHIRPPRIDKKTPAVYTRLKDAAYIVRRLVTSSKGGGTVCFSCLRFIFWDIRSRYESND